MAETVGVRQLRNELRHWLDRARKGQEILITERGKPVARLVGSDWTPMLERLIGEGLITPPSRPQRRRLRLDDLVEARGSVSELIKEQRR